MKINENEKSIIRLEKVIVEEASFKRYSIKETKIENDSNISFSKQLNRIAEDFYKVTVSVCIDSEDICSAKVTMSGFFRLQEDSELGKNLLLTNTVAILFPYIRSQLTLLTSQPGFEPVILPVMNINALFGDK